MLGNKKLRKEQIMPFF